MDIEVALYLMDFVEKFSSVSKFLTIFGLICFFTLMFFVLVNLDDDIKGEKIKSSHNKTLLKCLIFNATIISIFNFVNVVLPTSKTIAAIYVFPKVASQAKLDNMPFSSLELIKNKTFLWFSDQNRSETESKSETKSETESETESKSE